MYFHTKQLQYRVRVDRPDPVYARKLQELIGGQFGEMTVMTQYLFQGWSVRGDDQDPRLKRVKDLLLSTAAEEIGHVEMLATCVAMLLDGASPAQQAEAAAADPAVYAALGGMNPQHAIVSGLGARPTDSNGNPFNAAFTIASGNVMADMYSNVHAEVQGRLQAVRMYELSADAGVRDFLSFLIARDHLHQEQWMAAIEELGGSAGLPVPKTFPIEQEAAQYATSVMNFSLDSDSTIGEGRWAKGKMYDGLADFGKASKPNADGQIPHLNPAPVSVHDSLLDGPVLAEMPPTFPGQPLDGGMIQSGAH